MLKRDQIIFALSSVSTLTSREPSGLIRMGDVEAAKQAPAFFISVLQEQHKQHSVITLNVGVIQRPVITLAFHTMSQSSQKAYRDCKCVKQ